MVFRSLREGMWGVKSKWGGKELEVILGSRSRGGGAHCQGLRHIYAVADLEIWNGGFHQLRL